MTIKSKIADTPGLKIPSISVSKTAARGAGILDPLTVSRLVRGGDFSKNIPHRIAILCVWLWHWNGGVVLRRSWKSSCLVLVAKCCRNTFRRIWASNNGGWLKCKCRGFLLAKWCSEFVNVRVCFPRQCHSTLLCISVIDYRHPCPANRRKSSPLAPATNGLWIPPNSLVYDEFAKYPIR